jgi:hypothetical protein
MNRPCSLYYARLAPGAFYEAIGPFITPPLLMRDGAVQKKWKLFLTLPSPGSRGEGKSIEIKKNSLPLDGGGVGWG